MNNCKEVAKFNFPVKDNEGNCLKPLIKEFKKDMINNYTGFIYYKAKRYW